MLYEFAVEPKLLGEWERCRYIIEKFGVRRGRMISNFPKRWKYLVIQAAAEMPGEINKSRVVELLQNTHKLLVPSGRDCHFPDEWLKSAEMAHDKKPFHAILATQNPNRNSRVITNDELTEKHELFNCPFECSMPRDASGFVSITGRLLEWSRQVIFVDPCFGPESRWGQSLYAMLNCLASDITSVNYCTALSPEDAIDWRCQELEENLPPRIPSGLCLEITILEKAAEKDTHNRYILTERGGIKFPWGLDTGASGAADIVNLMDNDTHDAKFSEYSEPEKYGHHVVKRFAINGTATR